MICKQCKTELNDETATVDAGFACHDDELIDVVVKCNNCGAFFNHFIKQEDCVFYSSDGEPEE